MRRGGNGGAGRPGPERASRRGRRRGWEQRRQSLLSSPRDDRATALSVRPPRHRAADGAARAGRGGRRDPKRRPLDRGRRQQGGRGGDPGAVRTLVLDGLPHAGIELVFTIGEERGLVGSTAFDSSTSTPTADTCSTTPVRSAATSRRRHRVSLSAPGCRAGVAFGDRPGGGDQRDRAARAAIAPCRSRPTRSTSTSGLSRAARR